MPETIELVTLPEKLLRFNEHEPDDEFYSNFASGYVSFRKALTEIAGILRVMSDYSLTQFVQAIKDGKVDGDTYGIEHSGEHSGWDEGYLLMHKENFTGCLLGWGGFLENLSLRQMRKHFAVAIGLSPEEAYSGITRAAEAFVLFIKQGDTPETSNHSEKLLELVEWEQNRRKEIANA